MKHILYILFALTLVVSSAAAKTTKAPAPVERTQAEIAAEQELKYYFYQAMLLLDQNRYDETMALLLHCEQLAPDDAAVCHYLGVMYGGLGEKEKALVYHEKAYRLCPTEYWYAYCVQLYQQGTKTSKLMAISELEKIAGQLPDDVHVQETLQQMYLGTGDLSPKMSQQKLLKKALHQQDRIDRIDGQSPYGAMQRYQIYAQMGNAKQARKAIADYLRYDPDNYYMQVFIGDIDLRLGHSDKALEQYSSIRKRYPENPYLALSLSNYFGAMQQVDSAAYYERQAIDNDIIGLDYKLGILKDYRWLEQQPGAKLEALQSLVAQYPQEEGSVMALAQYYLDEKQDSLAEPLLWTALDINPKSDRCWQSLLDILQADSTTADEAYEHLVRRALVAQPEKKQWYYLMSIVQARAEQFDSVIYFCKEGLRQPEEIDLRYKMALLIELGDTYMHLDVADSAYTYYEAALAYDPENPYVLNNYAYYLATHGGDLRKAEKMSARCIKKEPDNATYLDTYAWILHLEGQDMLARFYMQQAWEKAETKDDPELVEHYNLLIGQQNK